MNTSARTWLYSAAQAISFSIAVISISISAIVGATLANNKILATLPFTFQVAAVIFCTYFISMLMRRFGRRPVFQGGCLLLAIGGVIGGYSVIWQSFILNCLAHLFLGMSGAAFMYLRFAATDGLEGHAKNRALSMVTFGSIGAAFIGPFVASNTRYVLPAYEFAATYFAFIGIAAILFIFFSAYRPTPITIANPQQSTDTDHNTRIPKRLWVACLTSGTGFLIMGLIMLQSSLLLQQDIWCGLQLSYSDITNAIQWHVAAMFIPSLFMPKLIDRFGLHRMLLAGYLIFIGALILAIFRQDYHAVLTTLIIIGFGWNILYVGGSILVTRLPGDAHRWQGINETCLAIAQTLNAISAGALFYSIGWINSSLLCLFLLLPGLGLLLIMWRRFKEEREKASVVPSA